jgi:hypothetical protein
MVPRNRLAAVVAAVGDIRPVVAGADLGTITTPMRGMPTSGVRVT